MRVRGRAREEAWKRFFPGDRSNAFEQLSASDRQSACRATAVIVRAHRAYLIEFNHRTAKSRQIFENRTWSEGALNSDNRVRLYRSAVQSTWRELACLFPEEIADRTFWMAVREAYLRTVFDDYEADLALTFFYSNMRIALHGRGAPVEYDDDGLAERSHVASPEPLWQIYPASDLRESAAAVLENCGFRARFDDAGRDAAFISARLVSEWRAQMGGGPPRDLRMLKPVFFRDQEAYLVGKLCAKGREFPVVFALRHEDAGIKVDAVLTGKEDMRNILFVSTRSTFHVCSRYYREVLRFLDTLAPERGHPAMCAVIGFTHPARVALNQRLRRHLSESGERFAHVPGRTGMAMIVFAPPSFPYVFKVVRDYSSKPGWGGRSRIMELYRWVHEMNRGRLMLDAWMYRDLRFARAAFDEQVVAELLRCAPASVVVTGDTVVLKDVYAQRRVRPLNTFFDGTTDRGLRERAIDALGTFIKDLARMGFFMGDHYGLTFNTGLTHGLNVALFDFDDLGPLANYDFRETPHMPDQDDELLWNTEADGAWFSVGENDVLVDEWERFLGVPPDLMDYFRQKHGDVFTIGFWTEVRRRVAAGERHYVLPYPPERRLP